MEQYTPQQRAVIVQFYIQNMFSIVKTQRAYRAKYGVRTAPSDHTIRRLHKKFIATGNLGNASHQGRRRPRRSDENIEAVQVSDQTSPTTSGRRRSSQLEIPRTSLRRIINFDLKLFPYKIQVTNRLLPIDKPRRVDYANFAVNMAQTNGKKLS